jgi:alpha-galactosidase
VSFTPIAELPVDPHVAVVYEHGWQSWSPAGVYRVDGTSPRPRRPAWQALGFRPELPAPDIGFQGEGLLAIQPTPDAPVTVWSAPDPHREVPSIRAELSDGRVVISADGEVDETTHPGGIDAALRAHADGVADRLGVSLRDDLGTGWCSWYGYWQDVTQDDVHAELEVMDTLDLRVDTVQLDDGYQAGLGDWLVRRERDFTAPLSELADRIRATGRSAGIWTAPFLVGAHSALAAAHPDWLVEGAEPGHHWGQHVRVLDVTHPDAAAHLLEVFGTLRAWGFTYHKIDFLFGGAMAGRRHADASPLDAYAEGLRLVREGIGDDAVLLGCGAPLLPSIGKVDAMRVSPDIDPTFTPSDGDLSQPSQRSALLAGRARAWQHGRWWTNDPDCVLVRPEVEHRDRWARYVAASGGLAVSGDPLRSLDPTGLEWTRRLLVDPAAEADPWCPDPQDPDNGHLAGERAPVP